jgi:phospholipase/carboxylesterase
LLLCLETPGDLPQLSSVDRASARSHLEGRSMGSDKPTDGAAVDDLVALLPALLRSVEALRFIARYLDPQEFPAVMRAVGGPDAELRAARDSLGQWPERLAGIHASLDSAADAALAAFAELREAEAPGSDFRAVFRALRHTARAQEALYPLAAKFPPVNSLFLDPAMADDAALQAALAEPPQNGEAGILHVDNEPGSRGGFSLYVPENYRPDRAWPLVMALHGGAGNGRSFLWNWLRDARSHGAILATPTATGRTWALMGDDTDTPNLSRILEFVRQRWTIDPARLLLTGMSDGGTFCYVSGLEQGSPFTHLAPIAASFHPMLAAAADTERLRGLPIYLAHGRLDWMFPVEMARQAHTSLARAGAAVTYREIEDLSHCYPQEANAGILEWLRTE